MSSNHYNDSEEEHYDDEQFNAHEAAATRRSSGMSVAEEKERRASIREIMQDSELTPLEKRLSIQSLMDGRRRSSAGNYGFASSMNNHYPRQSAPMSMAAAAAVAAAEFYDSSDDDEDQDMMDNNNNHHGDGKHKQESRRRSDSTASTSSSTLLMASEVPISSSTATLSRPRHGRSTSISCIPCTDGAVSMSLVQQQQQDDLITSKRLEKSRPPCSHYERECSIVSPCCGLVFGCRICHDECPTLPAPIQTDAIDIKRRKSLPSNLWDLPEVQHHSIDRFAVQQIICRKCYTKQDSKT